MNDVTKVTVPLSCSCGKVTGQAVGLSPDDGNRIVCHCDDCQIYAHVLRLGDSLLDPHGGTDIFQLTPSQIRIQRGAELLRCLRLREGGLIRWYTSCCQTPVANILENPKMPFAGVPHLFMDHSAHPRDEVLGPVLFSVQCSYAHGQVSGPAHKGLPPRLLLRSSSWLFRSWVKKRYSPSPFFKDGSLKQAPRILSAAEFAHARRHAGFDSEALSA